VERCIVFHGPGLAGKTTNMHWIYQRTAPEHKGRMLSLATETDRVLSTRIYPQTVQMPTGEPLCLLLCTVPGNVFYDINRERVLAHAHGVIFVADSQVERAEANLESLDQLENALEANGLDIESVPMVFQYNKRDLPNIMDMDAMDAALNPQAAPRFEAMASRGVGVFATLKACTNLVLG